MSIEDVLYYTTVMVSINDMCLFKVFSVERLHAPSKPVKILLQIGLVSKKYEIQKVSNPGGRLYIGNLNDVCGSQ